MKIRNKNIDKKHFRLDLTKIIILLTVILLLAMLLWNPIHQLLSQEGRQELKTTINSKGIFAPVIYITIMVLQILISVIPGQIVTVFGGFAFGAFWGTIFTLIGTTLGSALAFYLSRKFGRPLVEDLIDPAVLNRFDKKSESKILMTLLFIFLIPFTPDNAACLAAGLTNVRIRKLVMIAVIGRFPGILIASMIGGGVAKEFSPLTWISIGLVCIVLAIGFVYRERLEQFFNKNKSK